MADEGAPLSGAFTPGRTALPPNPGPGRAEEVAARLEGVADKVKDAGRRPASNMEKGSRPVDGGNRPGDETWGEDERRPSWGVEKV